MQTVTRALIPFRAVVLRSRLMYEAKGIPVPELQEAKQPAVPKVTEEDLKSLEATGVPKRVIDVLRTHHDPESIIKYLASLSLTQSSNKNLSSLPDEDEILAKRFIEANPPHYNGRAVKATSGGAPGFGPGLQASPRPTQLRPVSAVFPTLRAKRFCRYENFGELPQSVSTTTLEPRQVGFRPAYNGIAFQRHPDADTQQFIAREEHDDHPDPAAEAGATGFDEKAAEHAFNPYFPAERLRPRPRIPTPTLPGGVGPLHCLTRMRLEPESGRIHLNHIRRAPFSTQANTGPHVAVILSGCGVFDGTEIHEAVSIFLQLSRQGATYQCFAPDKFQLEVVNHAIAKPILYAKRNILEESARIARGNIKPLKELNAQIDAYDAIVLPGGYGAAKNLSTFLSQGVHMTVDRDLEPILLRFRELGKPIGMCCIAPVIAAKLFPGCRITLGADASAGNNAAETVEKLGAKHVAAQVTDAVVDETNKLVTTPAYMYDAKVHQVYDGIGKMIESVLKLTGKKTK